MLFRHKTPIGIRFADIDSLGHVNNAKYLTFLEMARVQYFDEVVDFGYDWSKKGIILAKAEIDFILPIHFKDDVFIYTRTSRLGRKSFDMEYQIMKTVNGKEILLADACTVLVAFDYQAGHSIEVPQEWRDILTAYEGENVLIS